MEESYTAHTFHSNQYTGSAPVTKVSSMRVLWDWQKVQVGIAPRAVRTQKLIAANGKACGSRHTWPRCVGSSKTGY